MAQILLNDSPAIHNVASNLQNVPDQALPSTLKTSPHDFLQPPSSLHAASLIFAKRFLDPLAATTSDAQNQRLQASRRKRKRGEGDDLNFHRPLQLKEVHLDGFKIQQIWEQARRVLDTSRDEAERSLQKIQQDRNYLDRSEDAGKNGHDGGEAVRSRDKASVNEPDLATSDMQGAKADKVGDLSEHSSGSSMNYQELDANEIKDDSILEDVDSLNGLETSEYPDENSDPGEESKETFVADKLGLNDGFFSIDDFNRQSEFLEHQDARGDNNGTASDEEDVDWDVDPLATDPLGVRDKDFLDNTAVDEVDDEEDGPTFDNADLNVSDDLESDEDLEKGVQIEDIGAMNNTNDIKYADFFAPPPRKILKTGRGRALPKTQPPSKTIASHEQEEEDLQRTISAVRRDILEDDLTSNEGDRGEDAEPRSSHQQRQAALTAEIRRLEVAAVAKRDWTLSGEARATDRPINSLLEEDIEFERAGRPIPVITQEVSEDIEALIKRRILSREFDEVIRRRPENLATGGGDTRRGRFELEDTKPQQSLAEVYEAEHLRTVDPDGSTDKRDKRLKEEHAKIQQMWKDVSAKLDALSSWHYKPKPPSATINVVADVPTISMEDARPSVGGAVGEESMLAPQEIYRGGEARNKMEEVITGSGLPVGREEMTRDEKTRRRRREKERIRKAGGIVPANAARQVGRKREEKQGIIGDLKKGGVKVIGKKGEIKDVEGRDVSNTAAARTRGGGYKL